MTTSTSQIAKHLHEVFFGGNWTESNFRDNLTDVTWQQSVTKVYSFNTIAALTYHIGYYITAALAVLKSGALDASDKLSFDHPPIVNDGDWQALVSKTLTEVAAFADLIERLPVQKLWDPFTDSKHGTYYRNLFGIIEHTHYHLGQIALLKKYLVAKESE